jgi:uncharacterized protein
MSVVAEFAAAAALVVALSSTAQPLTSPLPPSISGQGPGFHDPRSAFRPIEEKEGVLSWKQLSMVSTKMVNNRVVPTFPDPVRALNKKTVKVQGFMMPLEPGERQKHFLLSSVPTSCSFCIAGGPESLIEVRSKTPVKYSLEPVVVEGVMAVLDNDPYGIFYRVTDASPVAK